MAEQKERRTYPRIETEWPLVVESAGSERRVGHVGNISLSGALLQFEKGYELDPDAHSITLRLRNPELGLPELKLHGLQEWEHVQKDKVDLAIKVDKLDSETRSSFVRYLSRSEKLQVTAIIESAR